MTNPPAEIPLGPAHDGSEIEPAFAGTTFETRMDRMDQARLGWDLTFASAPSFSRSLRFVEGPPAAP